MSLKQHIPNTITCCNLLSGCFSILFSFSGMPVAAAIMVFAAGLFVTIAVVFGNSQT